MTEDLFSNPDFDQARYDREIRSEGPIRNYLIFFTPRSGSSWLGDLLKSTGKLGNPGEWLNPAFIPNVVKSVNARDARTYFAMLRRRQAPGRVFGMELTYFQLNKVFPENEKLFDYFNPWCPKFCLIREDIVAQAISLSKAVTTNVYHSVQGTREDIDQSESRYAYDPALITQWLRHIHSMERKTEEFFDRLELTPKRFTYEQVTRCDSKRVANAFCNAIIKDEVTIDVQSAHSKIGTERNMEFALRYREDCADLLAEIDAERQVHVTAAIREGTKFLGISPS